MGYLGRRIGKSQDVGSSNPGAADGAVGGGILDLFANGYFERQGNINRSPGAGATLAMTATGGTISDYTEGSAVYRAHIFTDSGTFTVTQLGQGSDTAEAVEYLVVGGGGGAGSSATSDRSGGGGAGGFRTSVQTHPLAGGRFEITAGPTAYVVTVGAGGAGGTGTGPKSGGSNGNGTDSYFGPPSPPQGITATGGGGGGSGHGTTAVIQNGADGGSGGGAGYLGPGGGGSGNGSAGSGNTPATSPAQGTGGGTGQGGGGGGAGGAGGNGPNGDAGAGSPIAIESSTAKTYAAGGHGGDPTTASDAHGVYATGEGGDAVFNGTGKSGGSGIVVIRYQIGTTDTSDAKATGGAISFAGGKTIHVFNTSGTFNAPSPLNPTSLAVEYLVVGGGGGAGGGPFGSADGTGGGGAGGLRTNHPDCPSPLRGGAYSVSVGVDYTVTVGAGGLGGYNGPSSGSVNRGTPGSASNLHPHSQPFPHTDYIRGSGGGGGGSYQGSDAANRAGQTGGSGGGGSAGGPTAVGGAGNKPDDPNWPIAQGNPGGDRGPNFGSGGGGGFTVGGPNVNAATNNNPGPGGAGVNLGISGSTVGYAGGGGGGAVGPYRNPDGGPHEGGPATHGGGAGADADGTAPTYFGEDGTQGTGGGGGGGGANHPTVTISGISNEDGQHLGGNGGSGIVIIAYPT